jgi:hypothetical protein
MNRLFRILIIIIASSLFVPVSCTIGVIGGTKAIAWLDSRDVKKGDSVHQLFSVLSISHKSQGKSEIVALSLEEAEQTNFNKDSLTFLLPKQSSVFVIDDIQYFYTILEEKDKEQVIEVVMTSKDGDNTIWCKYNATDNKIHPLSSRMFYFGYMFQAFPYAFIFSLCLFAFGKILKKRMKIIL